MKKVLFLWTCAALLCAAGCSKDDTPPVPPEPDKPTDLSAKGTANCYVVGAAGDYSFDATVMGNGVATTGVAASKIAPASAGIVWQDTPELLSKVELKEGRIVFTAGQKKGNALVAAYDAAGKVLWSWHIWVTDYDPSSGAPKLNGLEWMTRNLGARAGDYDEAGLAKGMVYQWGRKDPFPSGQGWTDQGKITVYDASGAEADVFENVQVAEANNLANAIANPTTYYYGSRSDDEIGPYDWYTTDAGAKNNALWETQADAGKTLLDPCPPGWRVPRGDSWVGVNETNFIWDDAALGCRHALLGYYPATGNRGGATGEWTFVAGAGEYWSSSVAQSFYASTFYFLPSFLETHNRSYRASGNPVRCVSETKGDPGPVPDVEQVVCDRVTEASYIAFAGKDVSCNYYIGVSNVPFEIDDTGEQMPLEPGMIVYFDLYGAQSEDPDAAVLPADTYVLDNTQTSLTADKQYTWARVLTEAGEVEYRRFDNGKVTVKHTDKGYSIEGKFTTTDNKEFVATYEGPLTFTNRTEGPVVPAITEPVDVAFTLGQATWEYSSDQSDRFTVLLTGGTFNGELLTEGYQLRIDLLSKPGSTKEKMVIEPGIYQAGSDYVSPMTYSMGGMVNLMGVPMFYGTYCMQVRAGSEMLLYGYAADGTIEVKRSDDRYEFIADLTTPEGVTVKGTYAMNDIAFIDNTPLKPAGPWLSILREDKTVLFNPDDASECRVWIYEGYYDNATEYEILVDNNTTDEAFQFDLLVPVGATSFAGTYTAAADPDNPVAGEYIPGYKQFAMLKGTWGYLYYDFDATNYVGAPAKEGTIEITDLEDGRIEIQYELKDDAEPQNTMRSVWSGAVRIIE